MLFTDGTLLLKLMNLWLPGEGGNLLKLSLRSIDGYDIAQNLLSCGLAHLLNNH
jgi:hypothetical protein